MNYILPRVGYEDDEQQYESPLFQMLAKATFLDPRYRNSYFKDEVHERIQEHLLAELSDGDGIGNAAAPSQTKPGPDPATPTKLRNTLADIFGLGPKVSEQDQQLNKVDAPKARNGNLCGEPGPL